MLGSGNRGLNRRKDDGFHFVYNSSSLFKFASNELSVNLSRTTKKEISCSPVLKQLPKYKCTIPH